MRDIQFLPSFVVALEASRADGRPVLVMPLGQGVGPDDDW